MKLLEDELDMTSQRLTNIETELIHINEQINAMVESLNTQMESIKETQRYLIKLARNQQELTKRISAWPYIVVNNRDEEV
jgi:peptidoglycan hydrolase CwlO-like protein